MKILTFDIETSPHLSFHWRRWQENIPFQNTVEESRPICWAAKWTDGQKVMFSSEWKDGFEDMLAGIWALLDEADAVVHFNGTSFDVKRLNAEFIRMGWDAPTPYKQIDLLRQARKNFAFSSNRLKDILKTLGLTLKLEDNANMELWMDVVYKEDAAARKRMMDYNKQDVRSTEELYYHMLGWIAPHPNWGLFVNDVDNDAPTCPNCGGHVIKKGTEHTNVRTYQRYKCKACGKHSRGRKHIGLKGTDNGILKS